MIRFKVLTSIEGQRLSVPHDKLIRVVRAYGIFDSEVFYKQAYIFMIPVLFKYLHEEEDVFFALCWVMITLGWREHFIEPYPRQSKIVTEINNYVNLSLPRLANKFNDGSNQMFGLAVTLDTLYDYVFQNIGFCGCTGLPVEVARRVFELVIFEGYGDESLSRAILYMLMITEEKVLQMDPMECFRYIGHGRFIAECFQDKRLFRKFIDLIRNDLEQVLIEE